MKKVIIFFYDPNSFKRCYPLMLDEEEAQFLVETWAIYESAGSMDVAKKRLERWLHGRPYSDSNKITVSEPGIDIMFFTF